MWQVLVVHKEVGQSAIYVLNVGATILIHPIQHVEIHMGSCMQVFIRFEARQSFAFQTFLQVVYLYSYVA